MHALNLNEYQINLKNWPDPNEQEKMEILIIGETTPPHSIHCLLDRRYSVVELVEAESLNKVINEHDFALIVLFAAHTDMSTLDWVTHLNANPFCTHTPIIAMLPRHLKHQEFSVLEAGAIDCLIEPVQPMILHSKIKNHLAIAEHTRQLEVASSIDGLTGLNNRTQLDTVLLREWYSARRSQHVISALMIDIDYFKHYNDNFGHLQGDDCLKAIASVIHDTQTRGSDFAARFGGEEFVVLLPFTDQKGAEKLAQDLIQSVYNLNIDSGKVGSEPVTISVGVSTCLPHLITDNNDNPWQLIEMADAKLYKAKQTGRNKFCS